MRHPGDIEGRSARLRGAYARRLLWPLALLLGLALMGRLALALPWELCWGVALVLLLCR